MSPKDAAQALEALARELDLVVYRLERDAPTEPLAARDERRRLHRDLDGLRDRLESVARTLQ